MADDFLTVAKALRPLTKTVTPSQVTPGRVIIHDFQQVKSLKFAERRVSDIYELSAQLARLHDGNPNLCVVRGRFVGAAAAVTRQRDGEEVKLVDGFYQRIKENLPDVPHHWVCIDVDGYVPGDIDPVAQPIEAMHHYIENVLPACFHGVSFHWQRSSSAGLVREHPVQEKAEAGVRCLKAHLWFWLATAYNSDELALWAKQFGSMVDSSVLRPVQPHYTANPVFEEGAVDPIPPGGRWGLELGFGDVVDLVLDVETLKAAQAKELARVEGQSNLKDPSEKPGIIGAFHRAVDVETLVDELLADQLEWQDGSNHRLTWLGGGGAPGGAFVTSDRMHIGAVHNTWPFGQERAANLFDVLRVLKFGHLDEGIDDFELLDPSAAPSYQAAVQLVGDLPAVKELVHAERHATLTRLQGLIREATDALELKSVVCKQVREAADLDVLERHQLAALVQGRLKDLDGVKYPLADVRKLVMPERERTSAADAPMWATHWVWVSSEDAFVDTETKEVVSMLSFNAKYNRHMAAYAEDGKAPSASSMALDVWDVATKDRMMYAPGQDTFFSIDGITYLNTYRPDLIPEVPVSLSAAEEATIEAVKTHLEILVPDARERRIMTDFLGHNARYPGRKIRWGILLKGIPGDGKSFFSTLMRMVMGHANVRELNSSTLESSSFTGWAGKNAFVVVEELKMHGHNRHDVFNRLKPYITNSHVEVHPKGADPFTAPNPMNMLLLTNYDDAVPLDDNDRRVMVIRSPFNAKPDFFTAVKRRTGLEPREYFHRLHEDGIYKHPGAVRKWLMEHEYSGEFDPNGDAPSTSAKKLMIDFSRGEDEETARDVLEDGCEGVYRDIVSVTHLADEVRNRTGSGALMTRRVAGLMADRGFVLYPVRVRWGEGGRRCRVYVKGEDLLQKRSEDIIYLLEKLELERKQRETDEMFS